MVSKYKSDFSKEKEVGKFLDEFLYRKKFIDNDFKRIENSEMQCDGIDIILDETNIDEKSQIYYAERPLPTFAFELWNTTSKKIGWAINDDLKTEKYMLVWINNTSGKGKEFTYKDIKEVECMLIKKEKITKIIKEYFNRRNYMSLDSEVYYEILKYRYRENKTYYFYKDSSEKIVISYNGEHREKCNYLVYSINIHEKPLNFIIRKKELKSIAEMNVIVTDKGYRNV